jgi:transposase InsO family protein
MLNIFPIFFASISTLFKSRAALQLKNMALRHQLNVLRRSSPNRVQLTRWDRIFFATLYRIWPKVVGSIAIVKPKTIVAWHLQGFRLYWRRKCGAHGGRPSVSIELKSLIRRMSEANPLWGAARIHGELLKLGIEVGQATISRYMVHRPGPPDQTWTTFLRNHSSNITSTDFFVVPTLSFKLLFGMVVLDHARRKVIHTAVTANPTAEWTARQLNEAFPWNTAPRFLIHDGHGYFRGVFQKRLRAINICGLRTAPRSPWQNAYVERVIGSIRRECLDHLIVLNERHLNRILRSYADYYNQHRTHLSLDKNTPIPQPANKNTTGKIVAFPEVGGLHHRYERTAS